uniref:Gar-1 n=1 Tax=Pristionchus pacificus TaxID=54126 RepID=A0A2A6BJJ0_PRIPA|eukprot:PDM66070.1 gar-1 [Pristionchus pacificus]
MVVKAIIWLIVAFLSLATIIGNAMVVIAYKIERNISKQVSNRYIVSLAVSDLIIGIEGFPLFTVYVLNGERWPLGAVTCETWLFLDYTLCLVSILTVLLITADRYLSVCHTAKYLKWQSPTKTQMTIIFSWVFPAIIFGVMIYGWSAMTGSAHRALRESTRRRTINGYESMSGSECSAPFLTNPFVNMGMYVAYYWTTLVAMLILYKGIHQAAKNLEKKAKAKERRHIALILSQRLGTQVGVSLMLQSEKEKEEEEENARRDSGYHTAAPLQTSTVHGESELNLAVIQEEKSVVSHVESHVESRKSSIDIERASLKLPVMPETVTIRADSPSDGSITTATVTRLDTEPSNKMDRSDSLSLLFNEDDDLSSVLHFKTPLHHTDSIAESNSSSIGKSESRRFKKSKKSGRSSARSSAKNNGASARIARKQMEQERSKTPCRVEIEETQFDDDQPCTSSLSIPDRPLSRSDRWVVSMRQRIARVLTRRRSTWNRSPSVSSSSSSGEGEEVTEVPTRETIKPNSRRESANQRGSNSLAPPTIPTQPAQTLLSPSNSRFSVSRKISSFGNFTRERMITSIFGPIISRSRKPTKAEKRAHKAFRTITFIVGFFAILWSPYYIMATIYGFCRGECIPTTLYTLSYYMCYLNSTGNPFAYALANRQFRSTFLRMLRGNFNTQV